jgi:hypothetical protein
MLKSIGRSSHFWSKIVGGTVSPPPVHRKAIFLARFSRSVFLAPAGAFAEAAMRHAH